MQSQIKDDAHDVDPRESLLKYAKLASEDPMFVDNAYKVRHGLRSGGTEEWGSGGVEEWRNGGMEEWLFGCSTLSDSHVLTVKWFFRFFRPVVPSGFDPK